MSNTIPMRVNVTLFNAAKSVGEIASRSAAQQINHWAQVGRELESDPNVSMRDIERVLTGEKPYDDLRENDQAIVRANWGEKISERLSSLDLAAEFTQAGRSWTETDTKGSVVVQGGANRDGSNSGNNIPSSNISGSTDPDA